MRAPALYAAPRRGSIAAIARVSREAWPYAALSSVALTSRTFVLTALQSVLLAVGARNRVSVSFF